MEQLEQSVHNLTGDYQKGFGAGLRQKALSVAVKALDTGVDGKTIQIITGLPPEEIVLVQQIMYLHKCSLDDSIRVYQNGTATNEILDDVQSVSYQSK